MKNMKPETVAMHLASTVQKRKVLEAKIASIKADFADELKAAEAAVAAIKAKIAKKAEKTVLEIEETGEVESEYRETLEDASLIGQTFATVYGSVSIQANPTVKVNRFNSIPIEYRKAPEQCLEMSLVRGAKKDGVNIPGLMWIDMPKVVVR